MRRTWWATVPCRRNRARAYAFRLCLASLPPPGRHGLPGRSRPHLCFRTGQKHRLATQPLLTPWHFEMPARRWRLSAAFACRFLSTVTAEACLADMALRYFSPYRLSPGKCPAGLTRFTVRIFAKNRTRQIAIANDCPLFCPSADLFAMPRFPADGRFLRVICGLPRLPQIFPPAR